MEVSLIGFLIMCQKLADFNIQGDLMLAFYGIATRESDIEESGQAAGGQLAHIPGIVFRQRL